MHPYAPEPLPPRRVPLGMLVKQPSPLTGPAFDLDRLQPAPTLPRNQRKLSPLLLGAHFSAVSGPSRAIHAPFSRQSLGEAGPFALLSRQPCAGPGQP